MDEAAADVIFNGLLTTLTPANVLDEDNVKLLAELTVQQREKISLTTKTLVVYVGEEVSRFRIAEEDAAMAALPHGFDRTKLNVINIGVGDRPISESFLPLDIKRIPLAVAGAHGTASTCSILSNPLDLLFKDNSIDAVISLHCLEHISDPVAALIEWIRVLKPGGGIGVVVPDWRYTWDSRNDHSTYGHKWNPTPESVERMIRKHLLDLVELEKINTYEGKLSFDFVLRKFGEFTPFNVPATTSGAAMQAMGAFPSF